MAKNATTANSKFVQKWPTVVQLRFLAINFGLCGATMVLQIMPFLHKFPNRYHQFMKRQFITLIFLTLASGIYAQNKVLPEWYWQTFKSKELNLKYNIASFVKPTFLQADLNGDKIEDCVALVINKVSKKKGILIIHKGSNSDYLIGAGSKFGKTGFDEFNDMEWLDGWEIIKDKVVYETKFDNGDIIGSTPRNLKFKAISVWASQDGAPLYGGIIYWTGTKYSWIHQGE